MYNSQQVQALISKYRLDNNVAELMKLSTDYPQFEPVIKEVITAYIDKSNKVADRLKKVGL